MGSADTVADLLSNLPEAILHHIISFLPGRNAVLTSLIARRWRHVWASVPCLDFDEGLFIHERTRASVLLPYHPHVLHNFIDRTLMLRDETTDLRALRLALRTACDRCRLDTWLRRAMRLRVQELDVSVDAAAESLVHIDLRCSEFLRVIKLRFPGSVLRLPLSGALSSLDTLVLDTVTISDGSFGEFISSRCPVLKKLSLTKCVGAIDLCLSSPLLEEVSIDQCQWITELHLNSILLERLSVTDSLHPGLQHFTSCYANSLRSFYWNSPCYATLGSAHRLVDLSLANVFLCHELGKVISSSCPMLELLSMEWCGGLETLTLDCPALRELSLTQCAGIRELDISAMKLEVFMISGCFYSSSGTSFRIKAPCLGRFTWNDCVAGAYCLEDLISLKFASIHFCWEAWDLLSQQLIGPITNLLCGLVHTESLSAGLFTAQVLSLKSEYFGRSTTAQFSKLRILHFWTSFEEHILLGIACFLRNSPNLENLYLHGVLYCLVNTELFCNNSARRFRGESWPEGNLFESLKQIQIDRLGGAKHQIEFVELLLRNAPALEQVIIRHELKEDHNTFVWQIVDNRVLKCPRASAKVSIVFL